MRRGYLRYVIQVWQTKKIASVPTIRHDFMNLRLFCGFAAFLFIFTEYSVAQNAIRIQQCALEPGKASKPQAELEPYILRLKLQCTLVSHETALLKVAVDPNEEQNFQTVAEKRLTKGKAIPLEFEIPIENWKTDKLNIYLRMIGKNLKQDETPLANITKTVPKAAVIKK